MRYFVEFIDGSQKVIKASNDTITEGVMLFLAPDKNIIVPIHNIKIITVTKED